MTAPGRFGGTPAAFSRLPGSAPLAAPIRKAPAAPMMAPRMQPIPGPSAVPVGRLAAAPNANPMAVPPPVAGKMPMRTVRGGLASL